MATPPPEEPSAVLETPRHTGEDTEDHPASTSARDEASRARQPCDERETRRDGVAIARLVALPTAHAALIAWQDGSDEPPVAARRIASLSPADVGRQVAVLFEGGDAGKPMIIGILEASPGADGGAEPAASAESATSAEPASNSAPNTSAERPDALHLDADQIFLTGREEIVLRCGKASVTLTKSGKVLIRGAYLLNRSSGVNRIKGGSVQIN